MAQRLPVAIGSTGSPLSPEALAWIYEKLGSDTWLFSTSGGTDVCTAFVGGVPTLPVHLGELQAASLACKVEAWSEDGKPRFDITRDNIKDTVTWNPWIEKAKSMGDFAPDDGYKNMVCVEVGAVDGWQKLDKGEVFEGGMLVKSHL